MYQMNKKETEKVEELYQIIKAITHSDRIGSIEIHFCREAIKIIRELLKR